MLGKSNTLRSAFNNSTKLMISIGWHALPHPIYHLQLQNHFSLTSFTLTAGARGGTRITIRHTSPIWATNSIERSSSVITQIQYTMKINQLKSNPIMLLPNPVCIHNSTWFTRQNSTKKPFENAINCGSVVQRASQSPKTKKLKRNFHACLRWAPQTNKKLHFILTDRRNTTHPITKTRSNIPRVGWYK